jgi:hypothetical protein
MTPTYLSLQPSLMDSEFSRNLRRPSGRHGPGGDFGVGDVIQSVRVSYTSGNCAAAHRYSTRIKFTYAIRYLYYFYVPGAYPRRTIKRAHDAQSGDPDVIN